MYFRPSRPEDAGILQNLINQAYRGRDSWTHEADLLEGQRIGEEDFLELAHLEVAEEGGRLVGCVHLRVQATICHLGLLTVDPACQGRGVGRQLLERSQSLALQWGCQRLRLTVIARRFELVEYYGRRGFQATGEWEPFPQDPKVGRPLVGDLRLLVMEKELDGGFAGLLPAAELRTLQQQDGGEGRQLFAGPR